MAEKQNVHNGHRIRIKKRFLTDGLDSFEHHNILELVLFHAIPRIDTNVIAHNLIDNFGGISEVFDAPVEQLIKIDGVTENAALLIHLIPQVSRVYIENKICDYKSLDSSKKIGEYFKNKFIGKTNEIVYLLCLDSSCCVLGCDILSEGTVSRATISVRKVVELVLKYNAYSVVLAHNHPRGLAIASNEDVLTTKFLHDALNLLDIHLLDHIIVAQNEYASLADMGYIL